MMKEQKPKPWYFLFILSSLIFLSLVSVSTLKEGSSDAKDAEPLMQEMPRTSSVLYWNSTWGGDFNDESQSIAFDSQGYIYTLGTYYTSSTDQDLILSKFAPDGTLLWNNTWGKTIDDEEGFDIVIDSQDAIYVAGRSDPSSNFQALIIKFDTSGNDIWNRTWGGSSSEGAFGIGVDGNYLYITGYTWSESIGGGGDIFLTQYDIGGNYLWNTTFPGSPYQDNGRDLIIDTTHDIYVVGNNYTTSSSVGDVIIIKFDADGKILWNETWDSPDDEKGYGISLDSEENLIIAGYNRSGADRDILILKYTNDGEQIWNRSYTVGTLLDQGFSVDVDSQDNIYVAGQVQYSTYNASLLKYNSSGDFQWALEFGGMDDEYGYGVKIDDEDNLFLTGKTLSATPDAYSDLFLLKYVEYAPGAFQLNSDAGNPDEDGKWTLSATASKRSDNYSLYISSNPITTLFSGVQLLKDQKSSFEPVSLSKDDGDYYFLGVAYNKLGNNTASLHVKVQIAEDENGGEEEEEPPTIFGYSVLIVMLTLSLSVVYLIQRQKKF